MIRISPNALNVTIGNNWFDNKSEAKIELLLVGFVVTVELSGGVGLGLGDCVGLGAGVRTGII
jgi:hypothetical protein